MATLCMMMETNLAAVPEKNEPHEVSGPGQDDIDQAKARPHFENMGMME